MWAQVNELLFKKYFGTGPVTPLRNFHPSKFWTGGWLSACSQGEVVYMNSLQILSLLGVSCSDDEINVQHILRALAITLPDHDSAVSNARCGCSQRGGGKPHADTSRQGVGKQVLFCRRPLWTTPYEVNFIYTTSCAPDSFIQEIHIAPL